MDTENKVKKECRFLFRKMKCICSRHATALNGLAEAVNEHTEAIANNSEIFSELLGTLADDKRINKYYVIKPVWWSICVPIIAIIALAIILFLAPMLYFSDGISIKSHEDSSWLKLLYLLLAATIVIIAIISFLKILVPYWTKIADLNDKRNEKLMRMSEEQSEINNMGKKIGYNIVERNAKAELDNKAKEAEHKQTMERMKQEYQTHLADVALEMVKAVNQSKEKDNSTILNQLLQILKNE